MFADRFECAIPKDSTCADVFSISVDGLPDGVFFLRQKLVDESATVLDNGYSIHSTKDIPYRELLFQGEVELDTQITGNSIILTNRGNKVISALTVSTDNGDNVYFHDGCIMLLPGESDSVDMTVCKAAPTLYCSGFGVPFKRII